jgi:hypothetical protein
MIQKRLIESDLEGSACDIEALSRYLPGDAEENHEKHARISDEPAEFGTRHLSDTSLVCYHYINRSLFRILCSFGS